MERVPEYFKSILWSFDFSKINPAQDKRIIVVQAINHGEWRHWQWIARAYGRSAIRELIEETPASEFRPSALKLASLVFGVRKMKYASRSAYIKHKKTLERA